MSEQLELFGPPAAPRACACGAALVGHINAYRGLCDLCILRKTISGHVWHEDPAPKRAALAAWMAQRQPQ